MIEDHSERGRVAFTGAGRENAELMPTLVALCQEVLSGEAILNGPEVAALEAAVASACGRAHAIAVNSATDALYLSLMSLGIGPGDDVLVPNYSFVASAAAVARTGARVVFADVLGARGRGAPGTLDLEAAAGQVTGGMKAMIWVGLFGGLADPAPIEAFAQSHGLALVEDASQSFGAFWGARPGGSYGALSALSFDRNKTLAAPGTGGCIVTDDADLAALCRSRRYHGFEKGGYGRVGLNSQMSSLTAAILLAKLPHLPKWRARRAQIAQAYDAALGAAALRWPEAVRHARHKYVLVTEHREALAAHLEAAGIEVQRHYAQPLSELAVFADFQPEACAGAARLAGTSLSLPIHAALSDEDVGRVTAALSAFAP